MLLAGRRLHTTPSMLVGTSYSAHVIIRPTHVSHGTSCVVVSVEFCHTRQPGALKFEVLSLPLPFCVEAIACGLCGVPYLANSAIISPNIHAPEARDAIATWPATMHKSAAADSAAADMSTLTANLEDGADTLLSSIRRPWCLLSGVTVAVVLLFAGGGPLSAAMPSHHSPPPPPPPPHPPPPPRLFPPPPPSPGTCGDGRCEPPETMIDCPADCPGITTPAECGEEPHSDPAGEAVAWGSAPEHRVTSASECCARCAAHAADPKHAKKPFNS